MYHELVEIVRRNALGASPVGEEIQETVKDCLVLTQGVWLLQPFDNVQVSLDRNMERRTLYLLIRGGVAFDAECPAFKNVLAAPGCFERLGGGGAGRLAFALAPLPPLDELSALGQRLPVVTTVVIAGDRDELPVLADFHLLENVDTRHDGVPRQTV